MAIYSTRYDHVWKDVKENIEKNELEECPRCHNEVRYKLVWDSGGIGLAGVTLINTNKIYAYKCPICPNFVPVDKEVAKALIARSKC